MLAVAGIRKFSVRINLLRLLRIFGVRADYWSACGLLERVRIVGACADYWGSSMYGRVRIIGSRADRRGACALFNWARADYLSACGLLGRLRIINLGACGLLVRAQIVGARSWIRLYLRFFSVQVLVTVYISDFAKDLKCLCCDVCLVVFVL